MGATSSKQKARSTPKYDLADRPSPPGKPRLVQQDTYTSEPDVVTISWDPPLYDGGSKLLGYLVEHRRTGSPHWVRASPVLVNQPELTLSGLEPGWRYQFRVSAKNAIGYSDPGGLSDLLTVTLQRTAASPPCFVNELKDTTALENDKIELKVDVSGTPTPRISWYKDGLEVFSSRRHRISTENGSSTLVIHQSALGDEGEIKCTATNRVGHATTRATLRLEAPPSVRLPRQYEDGLLFEKGEVIRLKVLVAGRPEPEVCWYHNGETVYNGGRCEISDAEKHTSLRIQEARRADRGEYHVKAVNKLGEDIASFLVTVTDRPVCPGRAKVVMTMGRSVTLSWTTPDDDGGCKIGNYIVEYYRIGWNMWLKAATCRQLTTTLDDLIEGSEYKFRVKAENPYGVSEPSEESDVIFIPDPKRGLLEPPDRGYNNDTMDIWLENKRQHNTSPWLENLVHKDSDTITRTSKNKDAKVWSEKNNVHHRETEVRQAISKTKGDLNDEDEFNTGKSKPVVPKRKAKAGDKTKEKNVTQERTFKDKSSHHVEKFIEEENQLRSAKDEELNYGSSQMMLVLLPNSRAQTEEREPSNREEFIRHFEEDRNAVAPPMSLSAPELGSGEIIFPPLRACVSSSELLHELTMSRVYQDLAQYETEKGLKRKHSFDQRKIANRRSITDTELVLEGNILDCSKDNLQPSKKLLNEINEKGEFKTTRKTGVPEITMEEEILNSSDVHFSNDNKNDNALDTLQKKLQDLKQHGIDGGRFLKKEDTEQYDIDLEDEDKDEEELDDEEVYELEEIEEEEDDDDNGEDEEEEEEEDVDNEERDEDNREDLDMDYNKVTDSEDDVEENENKLLKEKLKAMKINKEDCFSTWRRDYNEDEETYHPRNMIPKSITVPVPSDHEKETNNSIVKAVINSSPVGSTLKTNNHNEYEQPTLKSHVSNVKTKEQINEEKFKILDKIVEKSTNLQTDKEKEEKLSSYATKKEQTISGKRYVPARSPVALKPILKHRDHSQERTEELKEKRETFVAPVANVEPELNIVHDNIAELDETDDNLKLRKKQVRIEEPYRNTSINSTSEAVSTRPLTEENDPTKIVINHYSDIVAEFGKGKKSSHSLYLSYDELKAAAKKIDEPPDIAFEAINNGMNDDVMSQSTSGSLESTSSIQTVDVSDVENEQLVKEISKSSNIPIVLSYTERKVRWLVDFLTDLAMFLVACWLYAFKDERLAIPVLILMAYRQVHEMIMRKIPQRWRRK